MIPFEIETPRQNRFAIGLDLAQRTDRTALAVILRTWQARKTGRLTWQTDQNFFLGFLRTWPKGTPYTRIVTDVEAIYRQPAFVGAVYNRQAETWTRPTPTLAVDQTGIGQAVFDMLKARITATHGIIITGGETAARDDRRTWRVPKKDLISAISSQQMCMAHAPESLDPFSSSMQTKKSRRWSYNSLRDRGNITPRSA